LCSEDHNVVVEFRTNLIERVTGVDYSFMIYRKLLKMKYLRTIMNGIGIYNKIGHIFVQMDLVNLQSILIKLLEKDLLALISKLKLI
jgi:hypothetical protein